MSVPRFSIVIETANLSLAGLDGLQETLESLAVQSLPMQAAQEVLLADSGDVPEDVLQRTLIAYPWARLMRLAAGTGYEDLKMAGAAAATGDIIVFADGDCLFEREWLASLLAPFSDPSVRIVGGETAIDSSGPYGLAVSIAASFPARSYAPAPYTADRYHLNNVAFHRSVLAEVPIPSQRPCYRMSGLHAALLLAAGHTIVRQPAARARHAAPNGAWHFAWRFILMGYDGVMVPRLIAAEIRAPRRRREERRRTLTFLRFWTVQAGAKLTDAVRQHPSRVLSLPLVAPIFVAAAGLMTVGAFAGLVAPERLLAAVPDEMLRGSTCQRDPSLRLGASPHRSVTRVESENGLMR
jgi:glycosyltransferase involved in cell wall biosynthesis